MLRRITTISLIIAGMCACSVVFSGGLAVTNPLLSKSRPWCVGRFVFDRPVVSEISNQSYEFRGERIDVKHKSSVAEYDSKVKALGTKLNSSQRVNPGTGVKINHSWLERELHPRSDSAVFVYQEYYSKSGLDFKTEGYLLDGGNLFHTVGGIGAEALGQAEEIYKDTYRRIKSRDNWSVPTESGFCIDGGIVTGSSTYSEEVTQSFALMPESRPALLLIQMRDSVSQDRDPAASLLKTLPDLRAKLDSIGAHYRILRQGHRKVAGIDAEEVLFEAKDGGVTEYRFSLLAPGDPSTLAKPHTSIQMILGDISGRDMPADERTAPVDEAGALQAWDTLLNSLRLRPGAV
ncbi:T6SS immunity protein Tli4 family protein [Burkholderia ubonensis]|uniref:Lipoprotein n=1 Tax=Burkholderia ubonensis TaxID=101571 RepID=A0ABD4E730_9BURK|nr:T6SS immunity protein Tli4 family protein [Burkholderia ubonensis]KVN89719.1 hypothetical protein WJ68_02495 [Burkholderia ubonensis]KVZ61336.1 hypothetical protein WL19_31675 [Burkholderia ubonensis]KVZ86149.1 hypothetical protein WL24_08205 [Burkholderia ubonensis]